MRVAVVGAGAIGRQIVEAVARGDAGDVAIVAIADVPERENAVRELADAHRAAAYIDAALVTDARADVIVEAAAPAVVRAHAAGWLRAGANVLVMSVGALADADLLAELTAAAEAAGRTVLVPSGAIGGLDAVRAARIGGLERVELRTTKAPRSLAGAPGLVSAGIDLEAIREPTVVFEGSAREAVVGFPANLNVVAALSLAGIGPERTRVVLVADPAETRNVHEITASGTFGHLLLRFENLPSPDNPRTSYLAALSALALLRRRSAAVQVGS